MIALNATYNKKELNITRQKQRYNSGQQRQFFDIRQKARRHGDANKKHKK